MGGSGLADLAFSVVLACWAAGDWGKVGRTRIGSVLDRTYVELADALLY